LAAQALLGLRPPSSFGTRGGTDGFSRIQTLIN
jgi:hypothetical protein